MAGSDENIENRVANCHILIIQSRHDKFALSQTYCEGTSTRGETYSSLDLVRVLAKCPSRKGANQRIKIENQGKPVIPQT